MGRTRSYKSTSVSLPPMLYRWARENNIRISTLASVAIEVLMEAGMVPKSPLDYREALRKAIIATSPVLRAALELYNAVIEIASRRGCVSEDGAAEADAARLIECVCGSSGSGR